MAAAAILGGLIAGAYGVVHDQITYSISPEYFTRLKFDQFRGADLGFPERVFVAEIGFLATWWVGLIAGWFLARIAVPAWPPWEAWVRVIKCMAIIFVGAIVSGAIGWTAGGLVREPAAWWLELCREQGVTDVRAFVQVGYIHNAGYLGAAAGIAVAGAWLLRARKRNASGK